jgi:hypothetical protein
LFASVCLIDAHLFSPFALDRPPAPRFPR